MTVRVRFAPSPTGHLHVGGARTAIFNWLFARHHGGTFIIRVEDTDQARSTLESEIMVLDDLRWLGIHWDEGPDIGGPHAPYRQSERLELYKRAADELLENHRAYRCFCDEETLERKRQEAEAAGRPPHYDLTCFRLSAEEVAANVGAGKPFVVRFHVPREQSAAFDADVTINDLIRGEVTWKKESLGDFILLRSDGMPTYNFSCVVDDHDMDISHVIRAEEHLTNTHRQVLLYRAMTWKVPEFAHVSLILGPDRTKLSKRHGATSVAAFGEEGYLPAAMINYLTLLGWSPADGVEIFSRESAISAFSLDRVNPAPAVFDQTKLNWMNGQYVHQMDNAVLRPLVLPRLRETGWITGDGVDAWIDDAIEMVKKSVHRLSEFVDQLRFVFEFDPPRLLGDGDVHALLQEEESKGVIRALIEDLRSNGTPLDSDGYHALADRVKKTTGAKGKKLFMPIRVAITGSTHGPELHRLIPLLEKGSRLEGLSTVVSPLERAERMLRTAGGDV